MAEHEPAAHSLAGKLRHLVAAIPAPGGHRYSAREIADEINRRRGEKAISHTYVANLLAGRSTNPTLQAVGLLAELFGVPAAYFLDDEVAHRIDGELELIAALRQAGVERVATRMAGLSEDGLRSLAQVVEQIRAVERGDPGAAGPAD